MRQTSQAVLLLIASVSAADTNPSYVSDVGLPATKVASTTQVVTTQGQPLDNYLPADIKQPVYAHTRFFAAAAVATTDGTGNGGQKTTGTLSCIECIVGAASANATRASVWCSSAWNYGYKSLAAGTTYPNSLDFATEVAFDAAGGTDKGGVEAGDGRKGDRGSCCYAPAVWEALTVLNTAGQTGKIPGSTINKFTCPAKFLNDYSTDANGGVISSTSFINTTTNWWCSDGSYNAMQTGGLSGDFTAATQFQGVKANWDTTNNAGGTTGTIGKDGDQRRDLFFAACRQKDSMCGGTGFVPETGTTAEMTRAPVGFTGNEKCTWTIKSKTKAPSFRISGKVSTPLTEKFDIMYQEWVDGWQLDSGTDFLDISVAAPQNGIVFPHILSSKYSKAAKTNYVVQADAAAMLNNDGRKGMAYSFYNTNAPTACVLTATTFAEAPLKCFEDNYLMRWFPAEQASSAVALASVTKAAYDTAVAAYDTKATAYNTYLSELKTANEKDAFAAAFAPPTKPALVIRPTAPTKPLDYTGLQHWTAAKQNKYLLGDIAGLPAANEFILGNKANTPGWGAWTIGRIALAAAQDASANFIWHSFGAVGTNTSTSTTPVQGSYLKTWGQTVQVTDATTAAAFKTSSQKSSVNAGNFMCATAGKTVTDKCMQLAAGADTTVNTKYVYLSVSFWGNQNTASTFTADSFSIQFYANDWEKSGAYYAPPTATTPKKLDDPAAAQALAASAAAALAVAAALY